jgi:hypothetical protein
MSDAAGKALMKDTLVVSFAAVEMNTQHSAWCTRLVTSTIGTCIQNAAYSRSCFVIFRFRFSRVNQRSTEKATSAEVGSEGR